MTGNLSSNVTYPPIPGNGREHSQSTAYSIHELKCGNWGVCRLCKELIRTTDLQQCRMFELIDIREKNAFKLRVIITKFDM